MADGPASFWTQADAFLRKSLTFQKRNMKANIRLIVIPVILVMILYGLKSAVNAFGKQTASKCSCDCILINDNYHCETKCEAGHKDDGKTICPVPKPHSELPMIQIPIAKSRAVRNNIYMSDDFPEEMCRRNGTCPVVVLLTGNDAAVGKGMGNLMFSSYSLNASDPVSSLVNNVLGSDTDNKSTEEHIYQVQSHCRPKSSYSPLIYVGGDKSSYSNVTCVQGLPLWRNSSLEVNDILYKGYPSGNLQRNVNEILAAYEFSVSDKKNFDVTILYNATLSKKDVVSAWLPRLVNMISNAYLHFLKGPGTRMVFQFVKDMPMPAQEASSFKFDIASMFGSLFYSWVALLLLPVVLGALVYEKQEKLRLMMKMHGLGDGPYWMITYAYFLLTSMVYFFALVAFGSVMGLEFFKLNSYRVQFVFYFIYANLQISWAFLLAAFFSSVKTATVLGYILVFATGLLGITLFEPLTQSISKHWIILMELYPGFSLFRGLGEFGSYAGAGNGLMWDQVINGKSAMREVLIIMIVEWFGMLFMAYYLDQTRSAGSGVRKSPLYFLKFTKKPILQRQYSTSPDQLGKPDVQHEVEKVQQLLHDHNLSYSIIVDNLKKIYPRRDGNPAKHAVKGLSLAIPTGECFGMLGPNGAGKTSFISMMIGLSTPTSGTAYVEKMDIRTRMDLVYTKMGVCPQHDLLWETLTGREHLLFYGRLKNLKGAALHQAVEESLKGLNLFQGGVADKPAGKYSGGMKRRLSVAISLIGDPKVVYMDEPGTGLDPASRNALWNVIKRAKQGRAVILTTHSMEEAEYLCDRLGIYVDGSLQCVGNPKELKARYGGAYIFTMTTSSEHEAEVERLVTFLSPNVKRVYHLSGTQKFELPKHDVNLADVFSAVEDAKRQFPVQAWGIADTTLEDVFIKVARGAEIFNEDPS